MLTYECEGFLEVEAKSIRQLCRSTAPVPLGDAGREVYEVHAALCDYLADSEQRCRIVFYAKALKRALVFAVKESANQSSWQHGQEALARLGFQLADVDLKLSPAMQEVVLRAVPGVSSPAEVRKERAEKERYLAELQASYAKGPDSAPGKKAALKLRAEMHMKACAEELRQLLERSFSSYEAAHAVIEGLASQVKDLTSRLETAESLAEAERSQRQMSESITAAAERRIQELEGLLVDVETKSSDTLKVRQKNVQLQRRIKKLDEELAAAEAELGREREKQHQSLAEATLAHERISRLEDQLQETAASLALNRSQLAEEQAQSTQVNDSLKAVKLRIKALDAERENAEKKALLYEEAVKTAEGVQAELLAAQQALQDSLRLNSALEKKLAAALEQGDGLRESLQESEKLASGRVRHEQQVTVLAEQNERLAGELKDLRDEYDQECSLRKRLEERAAEEDRRIRELEESLARVTEKAAELCAGEQQSRGLESDRIELQEQKQRLTAEQKFREQLESEIDEARGVIESLEKMVKETGSAGAGQLPREAPEDGAQQKIQELELKLKTVEDQLEQDRIAQDRLAKAVAAAEKKITEREEKLARAQAELLERETRAAVVAAPAAQAPGKTAKPLPHELRPEPKKGAFFRPDWDLEGLPCQSSRQVFKAWETVFNVQISLEGYPSQYCMAYLVVLRLEQQKKLYLLYRLKQSKHTLICVPAKTPKDEPSLEKAIKEGLHFLKMSGFDMEAMSTESIDNALGAYFLEA